MKRKLTIVFSFVFLLTWFVVLILFGKFVFFDHVDIINAGYTDEIGFGMASVTFLIAFFLLPGFIVDFVKLCKSSGSPDDK